MAVIPPSLMGHGTLDVIEHVVTLASSMVGEALLALRLAANENAQPGLRVANASICRHEHVTRASGPCGKSAFAARCSLTEALRLR